MDKHFSKVKEYLLELNYEIVQEDVEESLFVVQNEEAGIKNLIIDCEDPILIFEQFLFKIKNDNVNIYKALLQKNREIIHGALVLDETGINVIFRDTLQLENIDLNEVQGTLNSLELFLSEYADELIQFSKN